MDVAVAVKRPCHERRRGRTALSWCAGRGPAPLPPTIEGNRQILAWLRGERQWYDEAEQRHRQVRLIDFDTPGTNVLHVTWEWRLKPPARKGNRADVMFLVNGVPVAIVEHKNPTDADAIERGVTQLRRYEMETPEIVGNQQNWDTLRPKRSGVGLRSSQLPECPVVLSSPLDCLGLHFLPAS